MMNYLALMVQMEKGGQRLRSIDIANRMGVRKPSVCNALEKLAECGCVTDNNGRDIVLTQKGRDLGAAFLEKTRILTDMLEEGGMEKQSAMTEAKKLAHAVSCDVLLALLRVAGKSCGGDTVPGGQE
ncbi:MAG: metal-dependent transcriptional regulator [Lachnospiraceae bacterium]